MNSLTDPLSYVTRKERRMLLGFSMLAIFFTEAGIMPSTISPMGIRFESLDQSTLLYLMFAILLYLISAFSIYALSDYIVWRHTIGKEFLKKYRIELYETYAQPDLFDEEIESAKNMVHYRNRLWKKLANPLSKTRVFFEFLLPTIVGVYAAIIVFRQAYTN